jgi:hypothetical protein
VEIDRTVWPADQYPELRAFHDALAEADRQSIVLWKRPDP